MIVFLARPGDRVVLQARGSGGAVGDFAQEVRPGESAFGKTHDEWRALPEGAHEA